MTRLCPLLTGFCIFRRILVVCQLDTIFEVRTFIHFRDIERVPKSSSFVMVALSIVKKYAEMLSAGLSWRFS